MDDINEASGVLIVALSWTFVWHRSCQILIFVLQMCV